jgi:hypothetical protein
MVMFDAYEKRIMACLEQAEANTEKIDPGMMQLREEHQGIPKGDAAIMPVVEPRKRRRVQNLAMESRYKRKDGTRRIHGSTRNSTTPCRKVSHHARVAW